MAIRTYHIDNSIAFRKTKEDFGGLSNMSAGFSINIHDVIIPTSEHLYQACRFPDLPALQWDIITEPSPMKAKWIAKANISLSRGDWDQVRFKIMEWSIEIKLSQNWTSFSSLLLSTGNKNIIEATPKDKIWGAVKNGDIYTGTNALGRLLMNVRERIVKPNNHNICVKPIDIPNFNFLGKEIGLICHENELIDLHADLHYYSIIA